MKVPIGALPGCVIYLTIVCLLTVVTFSEEARSMKDDPQSDYHLINEPHERGLRDDNFGHELFRNLDLDETRVVNRRANIPFPHDHTASSEESYSRQDQTAPAELITSMSIKLRAAKERAMDKAQRIVVSPVSAFWKYILTTVGTILCLGMLAFALLLFAEWIRLSELNEGLEEATTDSCSSLTAAYSASTTGPIPTSESNKLQSNATDNVASSLESTTSII